MSKQTRENPAKSESAEKSAAKPAAGKRSAPAARAAAKPKAGAPARAAASKTATAATAEAAVLPEGAKAPDFALPRDGGETIRLADFADRKLVIFFYPRANTPGCTKEAIDFTRLKPAFANCDTAVIGVSADSVKAQASFRDKHSLGTPLLSDPTHQMLEAYGAWGEKTLYGRKFEGVLRTTVLIGRDGKIARIWRNVKVDGHADQILAAAQLL